MKDAGANERTTTKTKMKKKQNEMNGEGAVEDSEVFEIFGSSSGGSDEEEERRRINGGGKNQNDKDSIPKKRRREEEEEDGGGGGVEEAKIRRFPMNRIRRIMRSEDCASQIMQDAVFLVNKATISSFSDISEVVAYLLVSAASSAVPLTNRFRERLDNIFSDSSASTISMAILTFLALALSALISGYKLSTQSYI